MPRPFVPWAGADRLPCACLRLPLSGHSIRADGCPLLGVRRTSAGRTSMRPRSNMKLNPEDLAKITDFTLSHYNEHAEDSPCAVYATARTDRNRGRKLPARYPPVFRPEGRVESGGPAKADKREAETDIIGRE